MKELELTNTMRILNKYGKLLIESYRNELSEKNINASNNLSNKTKYIITPSDLEWTLSIELPYYWKYVEEGIKPDGRYNNPGRKAFPFILKWTTTKGLQPKSGETREQMSWKIVSKIMKEGIKGRFPLTNTIKDVLDNQFEEELNKALTEDFRSAFDEIIITIEKNIV